VRGDISSALSLAQRSSGLELRRTGTQHFFTTTHHAMSHDRPLHVRLRNGYTLHDRLHEQATTRQHDMPHDKLDNITKQH
jgi:hypothetical protein